VLFNGVQDHHYFVHHTVENRRPNLRNNGFTMYKAVVQSYLQITFGARSLCSIWHYVPRTLSYLCVDWSSLPTAITFEMILQ